jgi:SAM-dependent methyltransferase
VAQDDGPRDARARSFGTIAEAYHRHRPGYPAAAVDWALAPLATPVTDRALLDLGAGTGKLTAALVGRAATVTAVEPDPGMLDVLRAALPGVTALAGDAEHIPLPDASVHAVLVGQAFHWFDPERSTAEIARVLRPGGVLALLWNGEDPDVDWVRGYYRAAGRPEFQAPADPASRNPLPAVHPGLGPVEVARFDNYQPATAEGLLETLVTFSWIHTLPEHERARAVTAARDYLAGRPETSGGQFVLPLRTEVVRAERRWDRR